MSPWRVMSNPRPLTTRKRKRAINHPHTDPPGVKQCEMDDTWDEFE